MSGIFLYLLTALLYAGLGAYFWRATWHGGAQNGAAQPAWERLAILAPLLLHTFLLYQSLFADVGFNLGVGNAVSAIVWLTLFIYWLGNFRYNLAGLQALVLPVASVSVLLPVLLPETHPLTHTGLPLFKVHLLISMLAYSLFTIAALHASLMALVERRLHDRTLPAALTNLPPLLTMEQLLFRIIGAGFILLTLTLASGILFSEELFNQPLKFNHKTLFGIISWMIYAGLLAGRKTYGWRGRTAIIWTLSGFAMLLLAYVGSKFVLEVLLHR